MLALVRSTARRLSRSSAKIQAPSTCRPLVSRRQYAALADQLSSSPPSQSTLTHNAKPFTVDLKHPTDEQKADSKAWLDAIEGVLPTHLRRNGAEKVTTHNDARQHLSRTILQSRKRAGIDLLSQIGLAEQRWQALLWITDVLLQTPRPSTFFRDHAINTSARWPSDQSLDEITASSRAPESLFTDYPAEATAIADPSISLDELTATSHSTLQVRSHQQNREVLGEIWRALGSLILAAASENETNSSEIMSAALRIIAQLHYQGYIPNKVCDAPIQGGRRALRQPPLLHSLSSDIFNSLIDTSFTFNTTDGINSHVHNSSLKPELWLEFVLWCCVHGGWLTEGAAIVNKTKSLQGGDRWHLVSWYTGPQPLASERTTRKARDLFMLPKSDEDVSAEAARIRRVISSEVVIALVDGLLTAANSPDSTEEGPPYAFNRIQGLKSVLERDTMNLGTSTWDEVIARLAEMPDMNIEDHAGVMEDVLGLSQIFGREVNAANALDKPDRWAASPAYVFDGSASAVGLYHRLLAAYVKARDTESALRVLARLQHFTDANKTSALESFLNRLTRNERVPRRKPNKASLDIADVSGRFQKLDYPSFFPNIPPAVLAALLDLVTESGEFDIGRWMVGSEDVDGPLIPKDLFSDQSVAPALIRFAAEAQEHTLLSDLRKVQSTAIGGETLVALTEGHLFNANWRGAARVLATIQQYESHEWSEKNLARIVGAHLAHMDFENPSEGLEEALRSLCWLFEGRYGSLWMKPTHRDSLIGVISTIHPKLADALAPLLPVDHMSRLDLSLDAFEVLLNRATQSFGSGTGQRLWKIWCQTTTPYRQIRDPDCSTTANVPVSQKAEFFSTGQQQPGPFRSPPLTPNITGVIQPSISTLRIIVHQALVEMQDTERSEEPTEIDQEDANPSELSSTAQVREVLLWAETLFMQKFNLQNADIYHELAGNVTVRTARKLSKPLYHKSTLRMWQAILTSNPNWLVANENKMRTFALDEFTQQMIFDEVGSAGRRFLHCLAADFGLVSESFGDEEERHVSVFKTPRKPEVPSITVGEVVQRVRKHSLSEVTL